MKRNDVGGAGLSINNSAGSSEFEFGCFELKPKFETKLKFELRACSSASKSALGCNWRHRALGASADLLAGPCELMGAKRSSSSRLQIRAGCKSGRLAKPNQFLSGPFDGRFGLMSCRLASQLAWQHLFAAGALLFAFVAPNASPNASPKKNSSPKQLATIQSPRQRRRHIGLAPSNLWRLAPAGQIYAAWRRRKPTKTVQPTGSGLVGRSSGLLAGPNRFGLLCAHQSWTVVSSRGAAGGAI